MVVNLSFLVGEIHEEIYAYQPKGFEVKGKEHTVYKFHKALYSLKQASRAWYSKLDNNLSSPACP